MKKLFSWLSMAAVFCSTLSFADVYVEGYKRSDGTVVKGHYRSSPDSTVNNNFSTKGNTNPYTGKEGTKDRQGVYTNTYYSPQPKRDYEIGKITNVCGEVSSVKRFKKGTYLNIDGVFPNEEFTFVVWDNKKSKFENKHGSLNGLVYRKVCSTGKVSIYKGHYRFSVNDPENLRLK